MSLLIYFVDGSVKALVVLSLEVDESYLDYTSATGKSDRVDCFNIDHIVVDGVKIDPVRL